MLDEKVVSTEEGQKLASEFGMEFWETSAKNDVKVEESFHSIAKSVKERLIADGGAGPTGAKGNLKLNANQNSGNKGKCC